MEQHIQTTMPPGTYYIGDPGYIFDKSWDEVLKLTNFFEDSSHTLYGRQILVGGTAYGDGLYINNKGQEYAVDAGLIGILPAKLLQHDNCLLPSQVDKANDMRLFTSNKPFRCSICDGVFTFDDIVINTTGEEEAEDY